MSAFSSNYSAFKNKPLFVRRPLKFALIGLLVLFLSAIVPILARFEEPVQCDGGCHPPFNGFGRVIYTQTNAPMFYGLGGIIFIPIFFFGLAVALILAIISLFLVFRLNKREQRIRIMSVLINALIIILLLVLTIKIESYFALADYLSQLFFGCVCFVGDLP